MELWNSSCDFIPPVANPKDLAAAAEAVGDIERSIRAGSIPKEAFEYTFKGYRSKESFLAVTEGRPGIRMIIDIRGMMLKNLESFERIVEAVSKSRNGSDPAILTAGSEMTEKLMAAIAEIRRRYPGADIGVGGDEIMIRFPDSAKISAESAVADVTHALISRSLDGRIAYSETARTAKEFETLDTLMPIHKKIERWFSMEIHAHALNPAAIPRTVTVHGTPPVGRDYEASVRKVVAALAKTGYGTGVFDLGP